MPENQIGRPLSETHAVIISSDPLPSLPDPRSVVERCSGALRRLLTNEAIPWRIAVDDIAKNPILAAEVVRIHRDLQIALSPSSEMALRIELATRRDIFPMIDLPEETWEMLWNSYVDALKDFSVDVVREAFAMWNRCELYPKDPGRHAFFPSAAELFALSKKYVDGLRMISYRAKHAVTAAEQRKNVSASPTEDERTKVREMMAEVKKQPLPTFNASSFTPQQMADRLRAYETLQAPTPEQVKSEIDARKDIGEAL